ncbi:hypothetical protein [Sporosarcina sp. FSL K6-2383]|uniref:hypothetical protein n=1 Tax=Sporosarcina sp. FSL K6-2383 TaxID=2921556 RepID=UPI00315AC49C
MTVITIQEVLLLIISAGLIALLAYWLGKRDGKNGKIYVVENGSYVEDYYRDKKNALKQVNEINKFIDSNGHLENMDKTPYYVREMETAD